MSHTIQVPDEVYEAIAAYAARHGQTPEEAISAWDAVIEARVDSSPEPGTQINPTDRLNNPAFDPWAGFRGITTMRPVGQQHVECDAANQDDSHYDPAEDPLAEFLGKGELTDPTAISRHDEAIAEEALANHGT